MRAFGRKSPYSVKILMKAREGLRPLGFLGMTCQQEYCSTDADFADEATAKTVHYKAAGVLHAVMSHYGEVAKTQDGNSVVLRVEASGVEATVSWSRARCMCENPWHVTVVCYCV
jgi:hypothetical protein